MSDLDQLHKLLTSVNVSDDMIERGVRLTKRGMAKVASRLGVSETEVEAMLAQLAQEMQADNPPSHITEGRRRFSYETDFLGNVTLRDRKTGDVKNLSGTEAFGLISEIERTGHCQSVIAPYFRNNLRESDGELTDVEQEVGGQGGTYNFPFREFLATARYSVEHSSFKVEVISVRDRDGVEVDLDPALKRELHDTAMEWVDKV